MKNSVQEGRTEKIAEKAEKIWKEGVWKKIQNKSKSERKTRN